MKSTSKETLQKGSRKAEFKPEVGAAMVDALADILRWERDSERMLKAAAAAPQQAERPVELRH